MRRDPVVIGGWAILLLAGQTLFPVEAPALEWLAVLWLWVGIWVVSPVSCLPLIILSYPAFLCENHRLWAWAQPVLVAMLLLRILVENRFSRRQGLGLILVATVVLAASWPAHAADLIAEILPCSKTQILRQWLAPDAVWAIFPFRQSADRALIAVTGFAAAMSGRYFSTWRIGRAFWLACILALVAALAAALLPWHRPHVFLGTSNYAAHDGRLFHGAGYNVVYLVIGLGLGLPWFFLGPRRACDGAIRRASVVLAAPALFIHQRVFWLLLAAFGALALPLVLARIRRRRVGVVRNRRPRVGSRVAAAVGLLGMFVSVAWFLRMGMLDPASLLRFQMRNRLATLFTLRVQDESLRTGGTVAPWDADIAAALVRDIPSPTGRRLAAWLTDRDRARGAMWVIGIREMATHHVWRGAGAGTWSRFHRSQPRPSRTYAAHLHNTYLDLPFEYGVVPMVLLFLVAVAAVARVVFHPSPFQRPWVFALVAAAILGTGQHLFHAFSTMCLLLPLLVLLLTSARALLVRRRATPARATPLGPAPAPS